MITKIFLCVSKKQIIDKTIDNDINVKAFMEKLIKTSDVNKLNDVFIITEYDNSSIEVINYHKSDEFNELVKVFAVDDIISNIQNYNIISEYYYKKLNEYCVAISNLLHDEFLTTGNLDFDYNYNTNIFTKVILASEFIDKVKKQIKKLLMVHYNIDNIKFGEYYSKSSFIDGMLNTNIKVIINNLEKYFLNK